MLKAGLAVQGRGSGWLAAEACSSSSSQFDYSLRVMRDASRCIVYSSRCAPGEVTKELKHLLGRFIERLRRAGCYYEYILLSSARPADLSLACFECTLASHTARCRLVLDAFSPRCRAARTLSLLCELLSSLLLVSPFRFHRPRASSLPCCAYSQDRDGSSSARWHGISNDGSRWVYGGEPHAPRRGYTRWARVSRCGRVATALARPSRSAESSPTMTMIPSSAATAGAVAAHRPPQMSMGEAAMKTEGTGGTSASHLP